MTAIEYVKMVIGATIADGHTKMRSTQFLMLIDKAKEMERNQIIEAMKEAQKETFHQQYDSVDEYYDKMIKK